MYDKGEVFRTIVRENILGLSESATYSYTNSYFWWKKIQSVATLFRAEIEDRKWKVKVLDVGCGNGFNIFYFNSCQSENKEVFFTGIDLSFARIFYANERKRISRTTNINFVVGDAMALSFPEATFDIVICTEVLEHLPHPELCVSELFRVLKPLGSAIITTPNLGNAIVKLGRILKAFRQTKNESYSIRHNHVSVKSLAEWERIFTTCGFRIEKRRRGGLIFGGRSYDNYRFFFALIMLIEIALDRVPFWWNLSEDIILLLRKPTISGTQ